MHARPRLLPRLLSPRLLDLLLRAVTHIRLIPPNQLHRQIIQLLKVVARVRDLPRLVPQPPDHLEDALEVARLLLLRVRVVVAEVALAVVVRGEAEVDEDGFGVADVQVAVGLGREARPDLTAGGGEVLFAEVGVDLGVLARFVEGAEEALLEYRARRGRWGVRVCGFGGSRLLGLLRRVL